MTTKILVADDSATMRRVLEMTFAGEDAQVLAVDSGEAAIAKAGEVTPDVIFADASMDGVDGYEIAKRVKADPSLSGTAVVVMASQHNPYDEGRGRACGVDDHISKPFDTQSVIDRVGQVLARPRAKGAGADASAAAVPPAAPPPPPAAAAAPRPQPAAAAPPRPAAPSMPRPSSAQGTVAGIGSPAAGPAPAPPKPAPAAAPKPAPAAAPKPAPAVAKTPSRPSGTGTATSQPAGSAASQAAGAATAANSPLADRLSALGLSKDQIEGVLALSREVIEQVVWEVVPDLAETMIKEEIKRLTAD